jgi:hypothetical protein
MEKGHASDFWLRRACRMPWEHANDKIERRVLAGKQGMIVRGLSAPSPPAASSPGHLGRLLESD